MSRRPSSVAWITIVLTWHWHTPAFAIVCPSNYPEMLSLLCFCNKDPCRLLTSTAYACCNVCQNKRHNQSQAPSKVLRCRTHTRHICESSGFHLCTSITHLIASHNTISSLITMAITTNLPVPGLPPRRRKNSWTLCLHPWVRAVGAGTPGVPNRHWSGKCTEQKW